MIDLKNTYIKNDDKEKCRLYQDGCFNQGIGWDGNGERSVYQAMRSRFTLNKVYTDGLGNELAYASHDESTINLKEITLADLKPKRVKVSYEKCEFNHAWEMVKEFEESSAETEYYFNKNDDCQIKNIGSLGRELSLGNAIYRKVEVELTWQEEVNEYLGSAMGKPPSNDKYHFVCWLSAGELLDIADIIKVSVTDKPE